MYWAFYTTAAVMLFVCAWLVSLRVRNYERGSPTTAAPRSATSTGGMRDFRAGVWMQTLLRDPAAGVMHSLIYFGFIWLFIATVVLEIDHQLPDNLKFLHGGDLPGVRVRRRPLRLVFIVGIVWAIGRRYVERPYRIRIKTKPEDAVILGTFLVIARHRLLHRGVPHRAGRPSRLREVVVRRVPALVALRLAGRSSALEQTHRWLWGVALRSRSSRSS